MYFRWEEKLKNKQPWYQRTLVLSLSQFRAVRFGADGVASFIKLGEAINPCLSGQSESQYNVCEHAKELFGTSVKCIGGGGADVSKDHGELTPNAHVPCSPARAEKASSHA